MIPLTFLGLVLAATFGVFLWHLLWRRSVSAAFRRLAAEHQMHYAERDLFQITPHVVEQFPIPGASDLRVVDVIYQREGDRYRYLFTIEYTLGVVRTKRRLRRAATFYESGDQACSTSWSFLELATADMSLIDQYAQLCRHCHHAAPIAASSPRDEDFRVGSALADGTVGRRILPILDDSVR